MEKERWTLAQEMPGGHKIFLDARKPREMAIADTSGYYPDETDDGVLYLDFTHPVVIKRSRGTTRTEVSVPVYDDERMQEFSIPASIDDVPLYSKLGMKVVLETRIGDRYEVFTRKEARYEA